MTSDLIESAGNAWNRFWFTPGDPRPCAVLRIGVGLLVAIHLVLLTGQLDRWFAAGGVLPPASVRTLVLGGSSQSYYHLSYFNLLGPTEARIAHFLAIASAVAFAAGLFSRVTGVLTLVALLSYFHRLPLVAAHVEPLLIFLVAYLSIGPADACLSLRSWLAGRKDPLPVSQPAASYWATLSLRLIQVHFAAFVLMMGLTKLYGDAWWQGEAIWKLLAQTHSRPLDLTFVRSTLTSPYFDYLINFWTHAVVYVELAFPVLVWPRHTRPLVLLAAALVWLSLGLASGLWLFSLTLIVASLAYLPAQVFVRRK
ncbi:MAG: hypothetical protein L0211_00845 [Planctomycetaceae bacterium]|nr:hypothetical protein [Planctomycetaceae bacterium]